MTFANALRTTRSTGAPRHSPRRVNCDAAIMSFRRGQITLFTGEDEELGEPLVLECPAA